MALKFKVEKTSGRARLATVQTARGTMQTPTFMPVSTQAAVKALTIRDLHTIGIQMVISNTYHLYLRPGLDVINACGGLHKFTNWEGFISTDSGGFQVYSLSALKKITDEGVIFASHIDGSKHLFTPEKVMDIQKSFGSDFWMPLDECVNATSAPEIIKKSVDRSVLFARRSKEHFEKINATQNLFGIIQGGVNDHLRERSVNEMVPLDLDGYAIGGLSVGEAKEDMRRIVSLVTPMLPEHKPRYLMGVGTPVDIIASVMEGVDWFDCVLPTRNARNGMLFTKKGPISIKNSQYELKDVPVDPSCPCLTCQNYSLAYLRHLFKAKEILAAILNTVHNITFYNELMKDIRSAIQNNTLDALYAEYQNYYE